MSAHFPVRIARPLYRQCAFPNPITASARPFSTTIARPARGGKVNKKTRFDPVMTQVAALLQTKQSKSSATMYAEQVRDPRNIPDDIGILPGTFIRAPFQRLMKDMPWSKVKTWKTLMWYYWKCAESKGKAWLLLWRFQRISAECPPLHFVDRKSIRALAADKYRHLYQSYANGDSKAISEMCVSGVAKEFKGRLLARPRSMKVQWTSDKNPRTHVVSNRALQLSIPGYENTGMHQIVVRIKSAWQVLDVKDETVGPSDGMRKEGKNVVEYIVLQRQVIRGEFKDWAVWGFADEWVPETIEEDAEQERLVQEYQAAAI